MRTTLTLDDDVARVAKALARERDQSMGTVISELARKGLTSNAVYTMKSKAMLPVFQVREDSPPITLADVKCDEDDR